VLLEEVLKRHGLVDVLTRSLSERFGQLEPLKEPLRAGRGATWAARSTVVGTRWHAATCKSTIVAITTNPREWLGSFGGFPSTSLCPNILVSSRRLCGIVVRASTRSLKALPLRGQLRGRGRHVAVSTREADIPRRVTTKRGFDLPSRMADDWTWIEIEETVWRELQWFRGRS